MLTATRALLRRAPVAKALGSSEGKDRHLGHADARGLGLMGDGLQQPGLCVVAGDSRSPGRQSLRFAIHFERPSEMKLPPKPNTAAKTSRFP